MKYIYLFIGVLLSFASYGQCPPTWTLTGTVTTVDNRQASTSITASNVITSGATARYHAGSHIQLKTGFRSVNGSRFRGYIEGCTGLFVNFSSIPEVGAGGVGDVQTPRELVLKESFSLSPNPASETVNISSDRMMRKITIASMAGVVLYSRDVMSSSFEVSVGGYPPGFYVVTVQLEDGEIQTQKLIRDNK